MDDTLSSAPLLQFRLVVSSPWDELLDFFFFCALSCLWNLTKQTLLACFAHLLGSLASHHRWVSRNKGQQE